MNDPESPYTVGARFAALFGRFEFALKRGGFLSNKNVAQADWTKFARWLGQDFFDHVVKSNLATNLLNDPPRKLMRDGLTWMPRKPAPLRDVEELFVQGVCRVRNSYMHGEKFVGGPDANQWERDVQLVRDALAVLSEAEDREPRVSAILRQR
jgi:hypothetical protein